MPTVKPVQPAARVIVPPDAGVSTVPVATVIAPVAVTVFGSTTSILCGALRRQ